MSIHRTSRRVAMRVVFLFGVLALLAVAAGVGTAGTTAPAAKPPFKVLLVLPTSGPLGFVGIIEARGAAAAARVINKQGGILGSKVELKVVDGTGDGARTVSAVQQELAGGTKYNLISCGSFGSDAVPCAAALRKNPTLQIPFAAETVLNDPKTYPNVFILSGGFDANAAGLAAKVKRDSLTRVAILSGDNATGRNGADALQKAFAKAGITVTSTVFVPVSAADATAQLQQAQASNPQAYVMSGFTPATVPILKARTKLGLTGAKLYLDWYAGSLNMGPFSTTDDRKNVLVEMWPFFVKGSAANRAPGFQTFLKNFYALEANPPILLSAPLVGWNALMLARGAAEKAKSTSGPKMIAAAASLRQTSEARGFFLGKKLYTPGSRLTQEGPGDYVFVNAGVLDKGLLVPDK